LTALLIVGLMAGLAWAQETFFTYLPVVLLQPSPTHTPTPTITPTPTATAPAGSPNDIAATLRLCNPGRTVYAVGENVCVVEKLQNNGSGVVRFGIVGVAIERLTGGSGSRFQTSWGEGREFWDICPGCTGPMNGGGGEWEDNMRGLDNADGFEAPGQYRLTLSVCYDAYSACPGSSNWRNYTSLTITIQ
jgi:hypothetical protein